MASMTLDEVLEEQRRKVLTVTVEEIEGDTDRVKLTPWAASQGCQCQLAIVVPKATIASVDPIGEKHLCCGQSFVVVDVEFAEGASIELVDLFGQFLDRLQEPPHHHGDAPFVPSGYGIRSHRPSSFMQNGMNSVASSFIAPVPAFSPCGPGAPMPAVAAGPTAFGPSGSGTTPYVDYGHRLNG